MSAAEPASGAYTGQCGCGEARYSFTQPPLFSLYCHCSACQGRTGSPFVPVMFVPKEGFKASGKLEQHSRVGGSGRAIAQHRCANCGQTIYNDVHVLKNAVLVPPATLDDPSLFKPYCHIHIENKPDWLTIEDGLPQYANRPEMLPPGVEIAT